MPIDLQLKMLDSLVLPILTYGAEVWGFEKLDLIDKLELQLYKLMVNFRKSTPSYMVYGELGRVPVPIKIKSRMVNFWGKVLNGKKEIYSLYEIGEKYEIGKKYLGSNQSRVCLIILACRLYGTIIL